MGDFCFMILVHFFARSVIGFTRTLDPTRPVTFVTAASAKTDRAVSTSLPFTINHIPLNAGYLLVGHQVIIEYEVNSLVNGIDCKSNEIKSWL